MAHGSSHPARFGWWGVTLAWLAWGAVNVLQLGLMPELSWHQAVRYGFPDVFIWAALTPLIVVLARRFEVRGPRRWRNAGIHALAALAVVLVHAAVDAGLATAFGHIDGATTSTTAPPSNAALSSTWVLVFFKVLRYEFHTRLLIYLLITGFVHYQAYAWRLAEQEAETARLAKQLTEAKLTNLRRQLRPHFLFNALQSITASMDESPARGRRVVRRLGELLRASLRSDDAHWISLDEELDLTRAYLEIEEIRFEDRLRVWIDASPEALTQQVPALILQPIVENAVSHGIAPEIDGGTVTVRAFLDGRQLILEVEDDGVGLRPEGRDTAQGHTGIGLANTRQRLATLFGTSASIELLPREGKGGAQGRSADPSDGPSIDDSPGKRTGVRARIAMPLTQVAAA